MRQRTIQTHIFYRLQVKYEKEHIKMYKRQQTVYLEAPSALPTALNTTAVRGTGVYVPLAVMYHRLCTIPGCYVQCMAAMYLAAMYSTIAIASASPLTTGRNVFFCIDNVAFWNVKIPWIRHERVGPSATHSRGNTLSLSLSL